MTSTISPLFLSPGERAHIEAEQWRAPLNQFYGALSSRVEARAARSPGLLTGEETTDWWRPVAEYLSDAAMMHALQPSKHLFAWLRATALSIARRPVDDWIGPPFRGRGGKEPHGTLETAHLCWGLAAALDLAPEIFTDAERADIETALREFGIPMCRRFLQHSHDMMNWRCILTAGVAMAAAVLDDAESCDLAAAEFRRCVQMFQPDGSYAEGVQYGNYAAYALMLTYEALTRRDPALADTLSIENYAGYARWYAYSLLYVKPLEGWGAYPRPRTANFNDSSAILRPSGEVLLHIAARAPQACAEDKGLARWAFEQVYQPYVAQGPYDLMSFGFVNDFGFLTLPLLPQAAAPLAPTAAKLPLVAGFSCGDAVARDAWDGRTVLVTHGGGEGLYGPGHLHGDLNSFILAHNHERLLVDPGHSCYRNLMRDNDVSTRTHNTCTFTIASEEGEATLEQSRVAVRQFDRASGAIAPPVERGARRLIVAGDGPLSVIGSDAAQLYGPVITEFARFWLLCGAHALFVVDRIVATEPVRTTWHWLLNNRDDNLQLKLAHPDHLVAWRGAAGMKLFHAASGTRSGPVYAHVHDAYHPLPGKLEGKPGSGTLLRWTEQQAVTQRTALHAIALDDTGVIAGWHWHALENGGVLEKPGGTWWTLEIHEAPLRLMVSAGASGGHWEVAQNEVGAFHLHAPAS